MVARYFCKKSYRLASLSGKFQESKLGRAGVPYFPRPNLHLAIPTLFRFDRTGTLFPIQLFHSQLWLGIGIAVCNAA
jgi:hypothetical protein